MDIDFGEIACSGENTTFQITADGKPYTFVIPNQAIIDFLGEMVDCPQFVIENQELFEEIAQDAIKRDPQQTEFEIDYQTITDYFY